jgi:hypothetical protein
VSNLCSRLMVSACHVSSPGMAQANVTGQWSTLPYVMAGGNPERGTYNNTLEIYQPPYLFTSTGALAVQPTITSAPSSIPYGNTLTVQTPNASTISSVVLVRNGTVTHAVGMDQRMVGMNFTVGSGSLTVTAPPNSNIAPPGYYMLFILNSSGVPSVAQVVQLLPMVTSVLPNSGSTAGGTAVTITGTNFAAGATVTFGGAAATNVVVASSTRSEPRLRHMPRER